MRSSDDFCKPVEAVQRTQFEGGVAPRHSYDVTVIAQHSNAFNIIVIPAVLYQSRYPDSKIHVAAMGPTWDLTAPDGPHIGPVTLAIRVGLVHPYYIPAITPIRNNCALGTCNKSSFILQINGNNMVTNLQTVFPGPLQWRHNEHVGVSNHQPRHYLLNRLFRQRSKKTPKLRVTGLCGGIHRWIAHEVLNDNDVEHVLLHHLLLTNDDIMVWIRVPRLLTRVHYRRPVIHSLLFSFLLSRPN